MNALARFSLPVLVAFAVPALVFAQAAAPLQGNAPASYRMDHPVGYQAGQPAGAQAAARAPLTLKDALARAERQNLDLVAARAQRAVAQAGVRIAGQRPNPTVNFAATRDEPHESLFFEQPLELGAKRSRRIELAKEEGVLTEKQIAALEQQVRREVRAAFFTLAFARGATAERGGVLKLAERLHEIANARFNAGDIPQLELTQADLELSRAHADFQVAEQEEKVALSELNALLNEPPSTDWELGEALSAVPAAVSLSEALPRAAASNSEIARVTQEIKIEQSRKALFEAQRVPNVAVQAGMDFNSPPNFQVGGRGQLAVELPIFSRYQGEIAQSSATVNALESELAAVRRSVDSRIESAYFDLEARRAQVQLYRDTLLPSTHHLEEMAEDSYRAGKANILTVLGAQRDVQQTERDYLDSLLAMQSAFAVLEEAVGAPLD